MKASSRRQQGAAFVFMLTLYGVALVRAASATATGGQDVRFDERVRADFFAGLKGDESRFERAMRLCEELLAGNPQDAEALVWHGSGLLHRAGQAYTGAKEKDGADLWDRGMKEMDRAVALQPENVAVLIPRGATLLEASRAVPEQQKFAMLRTGVADYEKTLALQSSYFEYMSVHAKGELLFGLAEGWHRLGDPSKAEPYFKRLLDDMGDTIYGTRAREWMRGGQKNTPGCQGCH